MPAMLDATFRFEISGHTDSTGSADLNRELSMSRAEAVRDYLVARGVDPSRLEVQGYGADRPIDDNGTIEGRARNRRVEITPID
jgi:outer membrane protein OmpA-like peptidoglycan-associated protein